MLWSGGLPESSVRIRSLVRLLPLPVLEASHFLNSIVGTGLLVVARGIQRRLNAAFYVTVSLLVLGIILSLAKGGDIFEASILAGVLFIFWPSKSAFYRKSSLLNQPFTAEHLHFYLDLGMGAQKIGEEARVDLQSFSLEGSDRAEFRQARRKMEREQYIFEILPLSDTPLILPRLKEISNSWMLDKNAAEKKFSLGFFDENYLSNFRIATAKKNGEVVAVCECNDFRRQEGSVFRFNALHE